MKDAHLAEQDNCYATTLSLADFGPELAEECFDVRPLDIRTCRVSEDDFERASVLPLHGEWYHGKVPGRATSAF